MVVSSLVIELGSIPIASVKLTAMVVSTETFCWSLPGLVEPTAGAIVSMMMESKMTVVSLPAASLY